MNSTIMVVVLLAGLACGAVIAVHLSKGREAEPSEAPPVLESQRLPWEMLHPEAALTPPAAPVVEPSPVEYDPADARVVVEAKERAEAAGVTEYVELTEELFIRLSAKLVIVASAVADHSDARSLLVDYEAQLLADACVDADEWYEYAIQAARDPVGARVLGEKIMREAEAHTDEDINVGNVTDLDPMSVAPLPDE